jgi:hypothetical protein
MCNRQGVATDLQQFHPAWWRHLLPIRFARLLERYAMLSIKGKVSASITLLKSQPSSESIGFFWNLSIASQPCEDSYRNAKTLKSLFFYDLAITLHPLWHPEGCV